MKLLFASNPERPATRAVMRRLMETAAREGFCCGTADDGGDYANADALIVIGGDGSLIHRARLAAEHGLPMLGVHCGRVGFLAETDEQHFSEALGQLAAGTYTVEKRSMIACTIGGGEPIQCLNDLLVFKHSFSGVAQIELSIDGVPAGTVFGDGVVVATPTGSTAYSLSAGGPIVAVGHEAMVVTPICSHTLHMRSIVADMRSVITLRAVDRCVVAADGERVSTLAAGDTVVVTGSLHTVSFLRFHKINLYRQIHEKLT